MDVLGFSHQPSPRGCVWRLVAAKVRGRHSPSAPGASLQPPCKGSELPILPETQT